MQFLMPRRHRPKPLPLLLAATLFVAFALPNFAGESESSKKSEFKAYNPKADARAEIAEALKRAQASNKHVLLQIGGNWCSWCFKLEKLYETNADVGAALESYYELVHVNYSPENKNLELMSELGKPQRFGFPVLVVLDQQGNRLHTQDSAFLERDEGHDPEKVMRFLKAWSVEALAPSKQD